MSVFIVAQHYHYDATEPVGGSGEDGEAIPSYATYDEAAAVAKQYDTSSTSGFVWEVQTP